MLHEYMHQSHDDGLADAEYVARRLYDASGDNAFKVVADAIKTLRIKNQKDRDDLPKLGG
ncbi:hypothetical protein B7W85_13030 [Allorhizobium ampelinum]|nr:hypothetical protein B7W85_13030 [Allorhizobium ampelinum]